MKKVVLALLFVSLIFGMLFSSAIVKADERNNSDLNSGDSGLSISNNSNSDSEDGENSSLGTGDNSETEDNGNFSKIKEKIHNSENAKKEFSKTITAENGATIKIERTVEIQDGKVKIKITRTIISSDGSMKVIQIEIQRDANGTANQVNIQGEGVNIGGKIEINDLFEGNNSNLEAVLSNGNSTEIKILPETARELVRERLKAGNISNLTLEEIKHGNIPRVVYNVETNQNGRFLGIFKLALKSETQVDPVTGEILNVSRPWWAFLVSVPDEESSGNNETNSENETALENASG